MSKVETDHDQTSLPTDFLSGLSIRPQERQKRPYHRRNIQNTTDENLPQETVIQNQPQTVEIAARIKRPYHQHSKTETVDIVDEDFLENYSLDKLRELTIKRKLLGKQTKEVEGSINTISQNYFDSEGYTQALSSLFSTIKSVEPDRAKLEKSYRLGFIRNLRVFFSLAPNPENPQIEQIIPKVINEFSLHCQTVTKKFTTDKKYQHLKPTFHILIQYPDLHHLETLDQIFPQINDDSFLSYLTINQLFKSQYRDVTLREAIIKKTEIFEKLRAYNQEHQLGATISDLRIATIFYAKPFSFLEKTAEKNRLKKRRNKNPRQPQRIERKVQHHRIKTKYSSENTDPIEPKKRGRKKQTEAQKTNKLLSGLLDQIRQRPISPEDRGNIV